MEVLTDQPADRFAVGSRLYREGTDEPLTILKATADDPGWRLQFVEVPDRTAAEGLRNVYLEAVVRPEDVLARGEYYWHEVIGAMVRDTDGTELGVIRDVYRAGGAEVFVVRDGPHGEFDVPAVRAFVRVFAPKRGEIVVDATALDLGGERPPRKARRPRVRRGHVGQGAPAQSAAEQASAGIARPEQAGEEARPEQAGPNESAPG